MSSQQADIPKKFFLGLLALRTQNYFRKPNFAMVRRRRYDQDPWQTKLSKLAKNGGKGAWRSLDRPAYVAFRRRFNGRNGLITTSAGIRRDSVAAKAYPGRYAKYDDEVVEDILRLAEARVKREEWTSRNKSDQQVLFTAREAFREVAQESSIRPRGGTLAGTDLRFVKYPFSQYYMRKVQELRPGLFKKVIDAVTHMHNVCKRNNKKYL